MFTSYYLACLETHQFVWIGGLGAELKLDAPLAAPVTLFCLAHRNKPMTVVNETHAIVSEGTEWDSESALPLYTACVENGMFIRKA